MGAGDSPWGAGAETVQGDQLRRARRPLLKREGMDRRPWRPEIGSYLGLILREEKGSTLAITLLGQNALKEQFKGGKIHWLRISVLSWKHKHVAEAVRTMKTRSEKEPRTRTWYSFLILAMSGLFLSAMFYLLKFPEPFKIASLDGY